MLLNFEWVEVQLFLVEKNTSMSVLWMNTSIINVLKSFSFKTIVSSVTRFLQNYFLFKLYSIYIVWCKFTYSDT